MESADRSVSIPLATSDASIGALWVPAKRTGERFSPDDIRLLRTIAAPLATKLANLRLVEDLRQQARDLQRLTRQVMTAEEDERRRLAREIHDVPLAEAVLLQQAIAEMPADIAQQETLLTRAEAVARELRAACGALRPPELDDLGIWAALEWFAADVEDRLGIPVQLPVNDAPADLPGDVQTALFRVAQEAINNAVQHGGCRRIDVAVEQQANALRLVISDDGRGFGELDLAGLARDGHYGLVGIRERISQVGGTVQFRDRSGPPSGAEVAVSVPLEVSEALPDG